jgi:hypothetical protein
MINKSNHLDQSILGNAKNIKELKDHLSTLPDSMPLFTTNNMLLKAKLKDPTLSLHNENYSALFTARAEMHEASSKSFIKGLIDYTHAICWKVPYNDPFKGVNASNLREELTKKIIGGVLVNKGAEVLDPSLLDLIMHDVSQWAQDSMKNKEVNYYVDEYQEVYDFRYSVSAKLANTAVLLEVSYIDT